MEQPLAGPGALEQADAEEAPEIVVDPGAVEGQRMGGEDRLARPAAQPFRIAPHHRLRWLGVGGCRGPGVRKALAPPDGDRVLAGLRTGLKDGIEDGDLLARAVARNRGENRKRAP